MIKGGLSGIKNSIPVAFVGDAAHTLDPILAQGSGMAIEDAYNLSHSLKYTIGLDNGLAQYEKLRYPRVSKLHYASNIAQSLGQIDSFSISRTRDFLLPALSPITDKIFDKILAFITMR